MQQLDIDMSKALGDRGIGVSSVLRVHGVTKFKVYSNTHQFILNFFFI